MLYKNYRPATFNDVIGQDANIEILKSQVKANKLPHAFLFHGERGCGKTTAARILAKAINCENPQDGEPCGQCTTCKSIESNSNIDITEIDAASNNGVDNIREITANVGYATTSAKYKVYIIDEVHMLSKAAANAFLKTLEEPPKNVIFILCTTESETLPITILSRCQKYVFNRINHKDIVARLNYISTKEGYVSAEKDLILDLIAKMADGALRDAITLLEQVINGNLTAYNDVVKLLGVVSNETTFKFLNYILNGNAGTAIETVYKEFQNGSDIEKLVGNVINITRAITMIKAGVSLEMIKLTESDLQKAQTASKSFSHDLLFSIIEEFNTLFRELKSSTYKGALLEASILKIISNSSEKKVEVINKTVVSNVAVDESMIRAEIRAEIETELRAEITADLVNQQKQMMPLIKQKIRKTLEEEIRVEVTAKVEKDLREQITAELVEQQKQIMPLIKAKLSKKIEEEYKIKLQEETEKIKASNTVIKTSDYEVERKAMAELKANIENSKKLSVNLMNQFGESNPAFKKVAIALSKSGFVKVDDKNEIAILASGSHKDLINQVFANQNLLSSLEKCFVINNIQYKLISEI